MAVPSSNQQDAERVAEIRARWADVDAPWVLESCGCCIFDAEADIVVEVKGRDRGSAIAHAPDDIAFLLVERDALRAQLQAVRDLHQRREGVRRAAAGSPVEFCSQDGLPWPCPTVIAASAPGVGAAQTRTEEL